jgi:hypothetical protein
MPNFSHQLPPPSAHQGYDIRRTPQSASLQAVVTSEQFLVCDTHYYQGRTTPCERMVNEHGKTLDDTPCPACQRKQPWRTHVYVAAYAPKAAEHYIFECTANAAKPFAEHIETNGTLRGFAFVANRPKGGINSKVVIQAVAVNLARVILPKAPDLRRALAIIWRLPADALTTQPEKTEGLDDTSSHARNADTIRTDPATLAEMREQLDDASAMADIEQRRHDFLAGLERAHAKETAKKNGAAKCTRN